MNDSRASIFYRERAGLVATRRGPTPTLAAGLNAAHSTPLARPLPSPITQLSTQGSPPPDRGLSAVWPPGAAGAQ